MHITNTHILVHEFDYLEPTSVEEAVDLLARYGPEARVLAGGTDLIVQMKMERLAPQYLVSIGRVPGLEGISVQDGRTRIGARTSIRSLRNDPWVRACYPVLAEACASFSTTQVQVMGTLGGNLGNASPASDTAPALIVYGAEAVVQGPKGTRRVSVEEFFVGPGRSVLEPGELLTAVELPPPRPGTGGAFLKVSRVAADLAKVNAAVVLVRDGDRVADARLAFGAVAPTPLRARKAEAVLIGQRFSEEVVAEAARIASEEIRPIDDVRSSAWYRREITRVLAYDGLYRAWERAGAPTEPLPPVPGAPSPAVAPPRALRHIRADQEVEVRLTVNGERQRVWVAPNELLLNVLREKLHLTGTKYGCGIGECSACTVHVDGRLALSCLVLAVAVDGSEILTVEGLAGRDGKLHPLQESFIRHAAFQCGYCTPGMLMTAKSLLEEIPHPTEEDVRDYLKGNLCRCTGYAAIVRAVMGCTKQT
ncbi:MAG: FAD binding domain-containing protein [Anaerolineae bacterium]|nr:FAD binding domain-containing protein [Anaerolineae bacterium]